MSKTTKEEKKIQWLKENPNLTNQELEDLWDAFISGYNANKNNK